MKESIYRYVSKIKTGSGKVLGYQVTNYKSYYSKRYDKTMEIHPGEIYDGATWFRDLNTFGWLYHDVLKRDECFADGSRCSNFQASMIIRDISREEGRNIVGDACFIGTLIYGEIKWFIKWVF